MKRETEPSMDLRNMSKSSFQSVCFNVMLLLSPKPSNRACAPNEIVIFDVGVVLRD